MCMLEAQEKGHTQAVSTVLHATETAQAAAVTESTFTCYGTVCMKVRPFCRAWSVPPKPSLTVPMLERPQPETPRDGTNPTYP